jgi:hypothetical protein
VLRRKTGLAPLHVHVFLVDACLVQHFAWLGRMCGEDLRVVGLVQPVTAGLLMLASTTGLVVRRKTGLGPLALIVLLVISFLCGLAACVASCCGSCE